MRRDFCAALVLSVTLLVGCGSGGGAGTPVPAPHPTQSAAGTASATLSLTIPATRASAAAARAGAGAARRRPAYISPATQSVVVNVTVGTAAPVPYEANLTTASCASGTSGYVCSLTIPLQPGNVGLAVALYSGQNGSGDVLANGSGTATIVANRANTISITLQAVLGGVTFTAPSLSVGTAVSGVVLTGTFLDPSGATIGANQTLATPVTLIDSDTTGATTLLVNGTAGNVVTSTSDAVTLNYTGASIASFTISASGLTLASISTITVIGGPPPNQGSGVITFPGIADDTTTSGPNSGQPTLNLTPTSAAYSVTPLEAGYSGTFTLSLDATTCETGSAAVISVTNTTGTSFTVSPLNAGLCKTTVSDGTYTATLWVAVVSTTIGVQ
jgi:hypothetical protein